MQEYIIRNISSFISILFALGAIISTIYKRNRDKEKTIYWETAIITISTTYLAFQYEIEGLKKEIASINQGPTSKNQIDVISNADNEIFINTICSQIDSINRGREFKNEVDIQYSRVQFTPSQFLGEGKQDDRSIYSKLATSGIELRYFLAFPKTLQVDSISLENTLWRKRMNEFSFKLLSSSRWEDDNIRALIPQYIRFYYLPFREFENGLNSWVILSQYSTKAGLLFTKGGWSGNFGTPRTSEIIEINNNALSQYLMSVHNGYENWANRIIEEERSKPYYEREPLMVFLNPSQHYLAPKSPEEITKIVNQYNAQWEVENGIGTIKPDKLVELNEIYFNTITSKAK